MMLLELQILLIIDSAAPLQMARATITDELRLRERRETETEIDAALRDLDRAGEVIGITNKDAPGGSRWRLSDAGKARVLAVR